MYRIYGRYLGRVRHSLLRRPYLFEDKWGFPVRVSIYTDYLSLLRLPSVVVDIEQYISQIVKPSYLTEETLLAGNLILPSRSHTPLCLYYTTLGICDYLATILATSVFLPVFLEEETDIALYIERNPTLTEVGKYQVVVRRVPSVVEREEYIAKLARFIEVANRVEYASRVYRTYPAIAISRYQTFAQRLPVVEEESKVQAELIYGGYSEVRLKGIHTKVIEGLSVYNNVFVATPINTVVQYVPQSLIIGIDYVTNEQLSILPKVELVAGFAKSYTQLMQRPNIVASTVVTSTTFPKAVLTARYQTEHLHIITPAKIYDYVNTRYLSRYTPINLFLTSYSSTEARTEIRLMSDHVKLYEPIVFSEDLHVTAYQLINQEPAIVLVSRYRPTTIVDIIYTPFIIIDYNKLLARYTATNLAINTGNRILIAPYVTLRSQYRLIYELITTFITTEWIYEYSSDTLLAKHVARPNVLEVSRASTALLPYYALLANFGTDHYAYIDTPYLSELSNSLLSVIHWTTEQLAYLKGGSVPYLYYIEIKPASYLTSTTYSAIAFFPHSKLLFTTNTALTTKTAELVHAVSQIGTNVAHYKASEQYIYSYTAPRTSIALSRHIGVTDAESVRATVSRRIAEYPAVFSATRYTAQNATLLALSSIVAQYLRHNVVQQTYGYYSAEIYGTNAWHSTETDYTLTLERYGSVAITYVDYAIVAHKTNVEHASESVWHILFHPSNVYHSTESLHEIQIRSSNAYHNINGDYLIQPIKPNATHESYGNYTVAIYRQLNLRGTFNVSSKYSIYSKYKLIGDISSQSKYAIQFNKASVDVMVELDVETSQYVR